jgi:hypothetical protein
MNTPQIDFTFITSFTKTFSSYDRQSQICQIFNQFVNIESNRSDGLSECVFNIIDRIIEKLWKRLELFFFYEGLPDFRPPVSNHS